MSRAFVKETAESAAPPERMVDDGPNLVTPEGLAQIEAHIARIEERMKSETNVLLRETLARDLRYWEIRKSTTEVVAPPTDAKVSFGSTVTIRRKGRQQTFRIVGVDEADASETRRRQLRRVNAGGKRELRIGSGIVEWLDSKDLSQSTEAERVITARPRRVVLNVVVVLNASL